MSKVIKCAEKAVVYAAKGAWVIAAPRTIVCTP